MARTLHNQDITDFAGREFYKKFSPQSKHIEQFIQHILLTTSKDIPYILNEDPSHWGHATSIAADDFEVMPINFIMDNPTLIQRAQTRMKVAIDIFAHLLPPSTRLRKNWLNDYLATPYIDPLSFFDATITVTYPIDRTPKGYTHRLESISRDMTTGQTKPTTPSYWKDHQSSFKPEAQMYNMPPPVNRIQLEDQYPNRHRSMAPHSYDEVDHITSHINQLTIQDRPATLAKPHRYTVTARTGNKDYKAPELSRANKGNKKAHTSDYKSPKFPTLPKIPADVLTRHLFATPNRHALFPQRHE